jgi:hypothetical protein
MKTYLVHVRRTQEGRLENNFEVLARAIRVFPETVAEPRLKFEKYQREMPLRN